MNSTTQKDLRAEVRAALLRAKRYILDCGDDRTIAPEVQSLDNALESLSAALPSAEEGTTCARCGKPVRHNCPRLGDAAGWVHAHDGSHLCSIPHVAPDGVISAASPSPSERAERAAEEILMKGLSVTQTMHGYSSPTEALAARSGVIAAIILRHFSSQPGEGK